MGMKVEIEAGNAFMLEMAAAALCDGDNCAGVYDSALGLAVGALRYRAKKMRERADSLDEGAIPNPDKLRRWAADDDAAADRLAHLLDVGREQVRETEGLTVPEHLRDTPTPQQEE